MHPTEHPLYLIRFPEFPQSASRATTWRLSSSRTLQLFLNAKRLNHSSLSVQSQSVLWLGLSTAQALRLINHLMERNVDARRKELSIAVYSIVPLSPCAGLIGWVQNTETLLSLIKAFRQRDGIPVNHEQVVLKSLYHKYEALTLLQKVRHPRQLPVFLAL